MAVFTDPQTSCTAKAVFWVTAVTGAVHRDFNDFFQCCLCERFSYGSCSGF